MCSKRSPEHKLQRGQGPSNTNKVKQYEIVFQINLFIQLFSPENEDSLSIKFLRLKFLPQNYIVQLYASIFLQLLPLLLV